MNNDEILEKWKNEQIKLKEKLIISDTEQWQSKKLIYSADSEDGLRYVAGLDISFVKDANTACSGLFIFDIYDNMKIVYEDVDEYLIEMKEPYIPGYLAYREAPFLLKKLNRLKVNKPSLYPQCIFIDGNGILHKEKFGMACHIGVLTNTPTIGISKKLCQTNGLENNQDHKDKIKSCLLKEGDYFELLSDEKVPSLLGYTYRSTQTSTNPIYVSVGHKISWETCLWILKLVISKYRMPDPLRQADLLTREKIRQIGAETIDEKGWIN